MSAKSILCSGLWTTPEQGSPQFPHHLAEEVYGRVWKGLSGCLLLGSASLHMHSLVLLITVSAQLKNKIWCKITKFQLPISWIPSEWSIWHRTLRGQILLQSLHTGPAQAMLWPLAQLLGCGLFSASWGRDTPRHHMLKVILIFISLVQIQKRGSIYLALLRTNCADTDSCSPVDVPFLL